MYCEWTLHALRRASALLRSGDLLTQYRENGLSTPAVARYQPSRKGRRSADAGHMGVGNALALSPHSSCLELCCPCRVLNYAERFWEHPVNRASSIRHSSFEHLSLLTRFTGPAHPECQIPAHHS